jgi:hypothetical protein
MQRGEAIVLQQFAFQAERPHEPCQSAEVKKSKTVYTSGAKIL